MQGRGIQFNDWSGSIDRPKTYRKSSQRNHANREGYPDKGPSFHFCHTNLSVLG
jgi:hypothetical protein